MIDWLEFDSKSLKGFPMGDPSLRRFPVYLPPDYKASGPALPVVFFLAGWGGKGSGYLADDSAFGTPLAKRFDTMIQSQALRPFIGVFPDASSKLGGSQYLNSPAFGNYSDYICDELTAFIDEKYTTHKSEEFRAIVGHSSGGFGALINATLRPDKFLYVGSSAGDSFFEVSILPSVRMMVDEIEKAGGISEFIDEFLMSPNPMKLSRSKGETMMNLSMAACYAPNTKVPHLFGDIFFDLKTGAINHEVWKKYLAFDPIHFIPSHSARAQKLKFILLDAGKQDEHGLQLGQRQLATVLAKLKIPHEVLEYSGGHSGHTWRFGERLKIILSKMQAS